MIVVTVRLYLKMVLLFLFKKYLFALFLVVSGLSCGMQFLSLWHSDFSLVVGHRLQSTWAL